MPNRWSLEKETPTSRWGVTARRPTGQVATLPATKIEQPTQPIIAAPPFPETPVWATTTTQEEAIPGAPMPYTEKGIPAVEAVPARIAAEVAGGSLKQLPQQTAAAVLQAFEGESGASVVNRNWADEYIAEANENLDRFAQDIARRYPSSRTLQELSQLSRNLAYSVTAMGPGVLAAAPLWLAPDPTTGTKIAASAVTGAVSGFVAYRMTTYQIVQEYLEFKDAQRRDETGKGLTLEEENQLKTDFHNKAIKYGLWEAVPEGISNMLFSGILTGAFSNVLTKVVGKSAAQQIMGSFGVKMTSKLVGVYGEELLTETITQKGQSAIEVEAGLREKNITWWEAFNEIAPQTFLLTTVMAGAGQTVISSTNAIKKIKNSLKNEIGTDHPLYDTLVDGVETQYETGLAFADWETVTGGVAGVEFNPIETKVGKGYEITQNGEKVGEISYTTEFLGVDGIVIDRIDIIPEAQRQGLATQAIQRVLGEAEASGVPLYTGMMEPDGVKLFNALEQRGIVSLNPAPMKMLGEEVTRGVQYAPTTAMVKGETVSGKEPWQMTSLEYDKYVLETRYFTPAPGSHEQYVIEALQQGKPVPAEVLEDYPDLAKVTPEAVKPTAKPVKITAPSEEAAVEEVAGAPPKLPTDWDKIGGDLYDKYRRQSTPQPTPNTVPMSNRLRQAWGKAKSWLTDEFARLNELGWQAELDVAMVRAADGKSAQLYRETMERVAQSLNNDSNLLSYTNDYLTLRHQLEVLKATGRKYFTIVSGKTKAQFTAKQIGLLFAQMKKELGDANYARVKEAASHFPAVYNQILRENQELTPGQIEGLIRKYPWYNPIVFKGESSPINIGRRLSPKQVKKLTTWEVDTEMLSPIEALPTTIARRMKAQAINEARRSVAELATDPKNKSLIGGDVQIVIKKPIGAFIDFYDEGQHRYLKLGQGAEWIAKDIDLLQRQPPNTLIRGVRSLQGVSKMFFTTYNPGFVAWNTVFDGVTTFFAEGISPFGFGKSLAGNIKAMFADVPTVDIFRRAGAEQFGFFIRGAELGKEGEITPFISKKGGQLILKNPESMKRFLNPFVLIRELGVAGENAGRRAVFEKAKKEGLSDKEAALRARRVTVDFSRFSKASRFINDWYIYFNPALQGFFLPGRAIRKDPRSLWRLSALAAGYIGLVLYNMSYDEYDDVRDSDKVGKLLIMLPSDEYNKYGQKVPHYLTLMPMREFALFTAPIEYIIGRLKAEEPEAYRTLAQEWDVLYPVISPLSMVSESGGLVFPTQIGATLQQIINNHDDFRDRDIVDDEMELLPPTQQYDQYTNKLAIKVGQALGMSPKKLDFFASNMFGALGNDLLREVNRAIEAIDREGVDERIANLVSDLREIPMTVPPNQIEVARETFLEGLSVEDRDLVLNMENLPDDKMPFVQSIFRRFFRDYGGQVYATAKEKALMNRMLEDYPPEALAQLQKDANENANNLLKGKITKKQYDDARTRYRAYYSGAATAQWREGMMEGAVARSEIDKYMPEAYQRSEEFQAVSAYMEIRQKYTDEAGGVFDSETWDRIEQQTLAELRQDYSESAIQYAIAHKDDWIDRLPEPARTVERQRATAIENETWWDDYRGTTQTSRWGTTGDWGSTGENRWQ